MSLQSNRKIIPLTLLLLTAGIISSCNNSTESKLAYTDTETIKNTIKLKETDISWTKELEADRLSKTIPVNDRLAEYKVQSTPDILKVLEDFNQPVYPEITDFGKLDDTKLPANTRNTAIDLCKSISNDLYSGPENFFAPSYVFNYIFFKNDLLTGWKKNFREDFPLTEEKSKEIRDKKQHNKEVESKLKQIEILEQQKKDNPDEDIQIPEKDDSLVIEKIDSVTVFTSWVFGEPFIGDDIIQLPVRFYCKQGTVDVTLYISQKKNNSIYQITIDRWGTV